LEGLRGEKEEEEEEPESESGDKKREFGPFAKPRTEREKFD
jgi:hypothetical protein